MVTDREKRLAEINKEIEALMEEKRSLSNRSLTDRIDRKAWHYYCGHRYGILGNSAPWSCIREMCREFLRGNNDGKLVSVRAMTPEEAQVVAIMATEIIDVWNKHYTEYYKDTISAPQEG